MDRIYAALGIHKLKLFVSQLKAANSLAVDSQARKNVLTDLELRIKEEDDKRITQEDKDKLFAIKLLLNVLKAKDVDDFNEQKRLYDSYLRSSMNARFANTPERPAPTTIKLARAVIDESLASLFSIIARKRSESPEAEAARQRRRAAEEAEVKELAEMFFEEARLKARQNARLKNPLQSNINVEILKERLRKLSEKDPQKGGKKTRRGRKGKKGTRKH